MHCAHLWAKAILCVVPTLLTVALVPAQTTVALSLYGAFNESTSAANTTQSPANAAGGLIELRQIKNPLIGYEATYAYNRANQAYSNRGVPPVTCGLPCEAEFSPVSASVPNNAHEFTGDWIVSFRVANLRPFALAGGGLLLDVPSSGPATMIQCQAGTNVCESTSATTNTSTQAVFVYGAGVDWKLLPHLGLRLQYRGGLYKAPDLINAFSSTNAFTHSAEPMIGVYFRL